MTLEEIRCELHQIPELGRKEFKTQEFILNYVKNFKCLIYKPTETSVVLYFNAKKKHTICFRSDMDALPITEENEVFYKSKNKNVMHACGHDGHMAMLLKFSEWANDNIDKLTNNIICLFQPSEEDRAGALDIIASNILNELKCDEIFGFHIWPQLEFNKLFTMPKGMLATSAEVNIDILGKSVHAANKKSGADALYASVKLIDKFYEFEKNVKERHLISFGMINSGTVRNAVAEKAHIEATLRTFDDDTFNVLTTKLKSLAKELEEEFKVKINLEINALYPAVLNDINLVNEYKDYLGLNILTEPFLQAEDFGCYTRKFKSLFMLIGAGVNNPLLHTANFDFDMSLLKTGLDTYIKIATK